MLGQYLPILAMIILGIIFAGVSLIASRLLAPKQPTNAKQDPYECGITSSQDLPERFPVRFFLVGMIFIVFDVEIIFMYPWATTFREIGLFGLVAMLIFSFAVFESFLYIIANGALEWGPVKKISRKKVFDPNRTTNSTIRRVGLEGRILEEEEAA
ncbi:MAG: NADH-ubiquinone/plastoquinone oxidoreductase chain 3 [Acidimicrobiaceae bacterium]|nr:NADH-ubiquinone/plastoquinone oxidoreductase chain 3 [Acidimicrobiaceae bacterium]MBC83928.1 NADH-ubiquinone/plastoquinone oxidoreductase chain 3 [Acidimicrobiaceae bacterium]